MFRVTAVYPNTPGSTFDVAYYTGAHAALAMRLLGPHGLRRIRVTLGLTALPDGAPPFWTVSEMIFDDAAGFAAGMAEAGEALAIDTPNYTDTQPQLFVTRLFGGDDLSQSEDSCAITPAIR